MDDNLTFSEQITAEVGSWPGVVVDDGELGELAFKVGTRELGHLHGEHAAHFGFPKSVWHQLHEEGRIEGHPVFPGKIGPGIAPDRHRRRRARCDRAHAAELRPQPRAPRHCVSRWNVVLLQRLPLG